MVSKEKKNSGQCSAMQLRERRCRPFPSGLKLEQGEEKEVARGSWRGPGRARGRGVGRGRGPGRARGRGGGGGRRGRQPGA